MNANDFSGAILARYLCPSQPRFAVRFLTVRNLDNPTSPYEECRGDATVRFRFPPSPLSIVPENVHGVERRGTASWQ